MFTSIENLPFGQEKESEHRWIEDYCDMCQRCAKECPTQAFFDRPTPQENGLIACVETEKCFPFFIENYGCSVCIRVCPFQEHECDKLKSRIAASA